MVLSLQISEEAERQLKAKAAAAGLDLATFAARQLELIASPLEMLRQISGPITESTAQAGLSETELSEFLETEKHAMRTDRQSNRVG